MRPDDFYLGTHMPGWLRDEQFVGVRLFVSRRRLAKVAKPDRAVTDWALDSGGFTELSMYGQWQTEPAQYVDEVRRWSCAIGRLKWAAIQDWMCEPFITAKTGLSILEHQRRTVRSLVQLRRLAPEQYWTPVLQGYAVPDYLEHVTMYRAEGIELADEMIVGLGSVCRRQATLEIAELVARVADLGIPLHGFGMKKEGLARSHRNLVSADSLAWSAVARREPIRLKGHRHINCANCSTWALQWRRDVVASLHARQAAS